MSDLGQLVEASKQFVEDANQLLRRALGRQRREAHDVGKENSGTNTHLPDDRVQQNKHQLHETQQTIHLPDKKRSTRSIIDTTRSYICPMKQLKQNIKFYLTQQTLTL